MRNKGTFMTTLCSQFRHDKVDFFLDAPGGTGKTFIILLILAEIRSKNGIALTVASSGIAATLLDGGRTAHSVFKLPLNIQNNPDALCNIKKQSPMATVLKHCKIIIRDECTKAHKHSLETLNRTLKDIKNNDKLFGGTLLLLSGDFRQTLPFISRSTYADEINALLEIISTVA
ncbi:ATP-dependent DNA helicase pif1-like [Parasteatoda tepidariorum]|uniref:ATP-dependent DNA helicase pif1-like n=1 Tax=Parasteatoda tepidariorum TaxID=114398 RepID=UPI0039BC4E90